jgi:hypothetical protein
MIVMRNILSVKRTLVGPGDPSYGRRWKAFLDELWSSGPTVRQYSEKSYLNGCQICHSFAIFSVARAVLLRPRANQTEDRLLRLRENAPEINETNADVAGEWSQIRQERIS